MGLSTERTPSPVAEAGGATARRRGRRPSVEAAGDASGPGQAPPAAGQILQAALELISSRNYASVTVKDIARAADVNVALIYYYYASKENLFLSILQLVLRRASEMFDQLWSDDVDPVEALKLWSEVHVDQFFNVQKFTKVCLDYSASLERTAAVDEAIRGFYEHEERILEAILRLGIERGVFRPVDVIATIRLVSAMIDGTQMRQMLMPTGQHAADIAFAHGVLIDYLRAPVAR